MSETRRKKIPFGWILPLLLALGVNANVLMNGLVWDDRFIVEGQPHTLRETVSPGVAPQAYDRPFIDWSYRFDRRIWGTNPFGFHLTVYLAHAVTTLLFYLCVLLLLRLYQKEEALALPMASLFAVHPIHAEAVAWIAGRNDVLMTMFMMLALFSYLRMREGGPLRVALPLFVLGCVLGVLSKETAIPFLLLFPALDLFLHRAGIRRWQGFKDPVTWLWLLILTALAVYRFSRTGFPSLDSGWASAPASGLKTPLIALGYYLKLLFIPAPLNLFVPELPSGNEGLFYLATGATGIIALFWIITRWSRTLLAVGAVWFALGILAPLTVPFLRVSATPVAERYAYLASGGFLLVISLAVWEYGRWVRARMNPKVTFRWETGLVALILALLSFLTLERNTVWKSNISLWEDAARKSPTAATARINLGSAYNDGGRAREAMEAYRIALKLKPDGAMAYNNLGSLLADQGRIEEAFRAYEMALNLDPNYPTAHYNMGSLLADQGRLEQALWEYQTSIHLAPEFAEAHNNLGSVYAEQGNLDPAIREFRRALELKPVLVEAHFNLGNAYLRQGKTVEARNAFEKALQIKPGFLPAQEALKTSRSSP